VGTLGGEVVDGFQSYGRRAQALTGSIRGINTNTSSTDRPSRAPSVLSACPAPYAVTIDSNKTDFGTCQTRMSGSSVPTPYARAARKSEIQRAALTCPTNLSAAGDSQPNCPSREHLQDPPAQPLIKRATHRRAEACSNRAPGPARTVRTPALTFSHGA